MVQEFNKFGPIIRNDPDHPNPDNIPSASEAAVAESAAIGRQAEEPADDSNDADADGHDDETGQFVPGNQEAADAEAPVETPPTE